jgi:hypothetical protein
MALQIRHRLLSQIRLLLFRATSLNESDKLGCAGRRDDHVERVHYFLESQIFHAQLKSAAPVRGGGPYAGRG